MNLYKKKGYAKAAGMKHDTGCRNAYINELYNFTCVLFRCCLHLPANDRNHQYCD
jgi:hypothetical protein